MRWFLVLSVFSLFIGCAPKEKPPKKGDTSHRLATVNRAKFKEKLAQPIPKWIEESVCASLAPFQEKGISQRALTATYEKIQKEAPNAPYFCRYRILDQKIYRKGEDLSQMDHFFRTLLLLTPVPDVDFILSQCDGIPLDDAPMNFWIPEDQEEQSPLFAFAKAKGALNVICIPDRFTIPEWPNLIREILQANGQYPWERKKRMAVWRGQPSDSFRRLWESSFLMQHYQTRPRYLLCSLSQMYPDFIDAGFNAPGGIPQVLIEGVLPLMKPGFSPSDHLTCAYLPVLDGAMCTFPGYLWRLLSNSLPLKQEAMTEQWFYSALRPYVHYLPIQEDLSNLIEQIDWARSHDEECRKMAEAGTEFVLSNLMPEDLYLYQSYLLEQYAACQKLQGKDLREETEKDPSWAKIFTDRDRRRAISKME